MAKFPKSQESQLNLLLANENRMATSSNVYQRLAQTNAPFMTISDVEGAKLGQQFAAILTVTK